MPIQSEMSHNSQPAPNIVRLLDVQKKKTLSLHEAKVVAEETAKLGPQAYAEAVYSIITTLFFPNKQVTIGDQKINPHAEMLAIKQILYAEKRSQNAVEEVTPRLARAVTLPLNEKEKISRASLLLHALDTAYLPDKTEEVQSVANVRDTIITAGYAHTLATTVFYTLHNIKRVSMLPNVTRQIDQMIDAIPNNFIARSQHSQEASTEILSTIAQRGIQEYQVIGTAQKKLEEQQFNAFAEYISAETPGLRAFWRGQIVLLSNAYTKLEVGTPLYESLREKKYVPFIRTITANLLHFNKLAEEHGVDELPQKKMIGMTMLSPVYITPTMDRPMQEQLRGLREWQQWMLMLSTQPTTLQNKEQRMLLKDFAQQLGVKTFLSDITFLMLTEGMRITEEGYVCPDFLSRNPLFQKALQLKSWGAFPTMYQTVASRAIAQEMDRLHTTLGNLLENKQTSESTDACITAMTNVNSLSPLLSSVKSNYVTTYEDISQGFESIDRTIVQNADDVFTNFEYFTNTTLLEAVANRNRLPVIAGSVMSVSVVSPKILEAGSQTGIDSVTFNFVGQDRERWAAFVEIQTQQDERPIPALISSTGEIQLLIPDDAIPVGLTGMYKHTVGFMLTLLLTTEKVKAEKREIVAKTVADNPDTQASRRSQPTTDTNIRYLPRRSYEVHADGLHTVLSREVTPHSVDAYHRGRPGYLALQELARKIQAAGELLPVVTDAATWERLEREITMDIQMYNSERERFTFSDAALLSPNAIIVRDPLYPDAELAAKYTVQGYHTGEQRAHIQKKFRLSGNPAADLIAMHTLLGTTVQPLSPEDE